MFYFNPVPPPCVDGDERDNGYLNAVDDYIDELWLQEKFENELEKERNDAST